MNEFIIITGASANHFSPLRNLLYTLSIFESLTRVFVYDLGLEIDQVSELKDSGHEPIRFPFENYPGHVNIALDAGHYAWKPIIIEEIVEKTGASVLWLDAGNLVLRKLYKIRKVLAWRGFYSPLSSGNIEKWTHPGTLEYLHVSSDLLNKRNRNGAVVGFNPSRPGIREFVGKWKACALDPHCIAPVGSNRLNHRQDQAVLSVLTYQMLKNYGRSFENVFLDVSVHHDHLSLEEVQKLCRIGRKAVNAVPGHAFSPISAKQTKHHVEVKNL